MKTLLNTTLLFLLVIGFSGGVSGQDVSDFEETKRLAEQGDASAQYNLGVMYERGRGVPENYTEAVKWYRLAAEQGVAFAQSNLGSMYRTGDGVPENDVEAVRWYRLAAEQGLALPLMVLALFHLMLIDHVETGYLLLTEHSFAGLLLGQVAEIQALIFVVQADLLFQTNTQIDLQHAV